MGKTNYDIMPNRRGDLLKTAVMEHLFPFFGLPIPDKDRAIELSGYRMQQVLKYQLLEEPGPAEEGQFMLVLRGLVDSYYQCKFTEKHWGRHIYYRHDAIFSPESFFRGENRTEYIRALEPSLLLTLPYTLLHELGRQHHEVTAKLRALTAHHTEHLIAYNLRNTLPAKARIRAFIEQHPTLPHRTTAEVCAMHNHMSRYWFAKTLSNL